VAPRVGTGEREGYATAVAELWTNLARTLGRLDDAADTEDLDSLPSLQYRLHEAIELLAGFDPPNGAEEAHADLLEALEDARDLTGEVVASGEVAGHLHQWRGALFRVRLARSQLLLPRALPPAVREDEELDAGQASLAPQLAALTLMLLAAVALVVGALLGPWPVWAAGLVLVVGALLLVRA